MVVSVRLDQWRSNTRSSLQVHVTSAAPQLQLDYILTHHCSYEYVPTLAEKHLHCQSTSWESTSLGSYLLLNSGVLKTSFHFVFKSCVTLRLGQFHLVSLTNSYSIQSGSWSKYILLCMTSGVLKSRGKSCCQAVTWLTCILILKDFVAT